MPVYHLGPKRRRKPADPAEPPKPHGGVGTELKKIIGWLAGLRPAGKKCGCDERAKTLDENGVAWCEANVETVVSWLREGAAELGILFHELPARWAIYIAIKRAKQSGLE